MHEGSAQHHHGRRIQGRGGDQSFRGLRLDAGIIDRLPELKLTATRSAGYDHIDLAACREHGVAIANVPD
ncbi:hypothetical protein ACO2RV_21675 [Ancylobacter sp. VNQ12]|uniref:hypothetical protein n=1 Tax=Ancylobacter sp. VNQ12 TaxID=3400920 RepID=UPI003C0D1685